MMRLFQKKTQDVKVMTVNLKNQMITQIKKMIKKRTTRKKMIKKRTTRKKKIQP
jgi:hypothetical protein